MRGHTGFVTPAFQGSAYTLPSWGRPGPNTLSAWTCCPKLATPMGTPESSPPATSLPSSHHPSVSLPGCPDLSPCADPLQAPGGRPPKPAWAHTVRVSSGKPELQRAGTGDLTCQLGSLGLAGAPSRPLFSKLRAAGPSLHVRSYSGADSSRRRAVRGGAAGR